MKKPTRKALIDEISRKIPVGKTFSIAPELDAILMEDDMPKAKKSASMKPVADNEASTEEPKEATASNDKPKSNTAKKARENNIIWRGKEDPPTVRIGSRVLHLPNADEQRAGFYHAEAGNIRRAHSNYKLLKPKG